MSYDSIENDVDKIAERQEQEEREQAKRHAAFLLDVKDTVKTPGGRKLILWILEATNFNGNNFSVNDRETNYLLGRASVAHDILSLVEEIDPELYPRMLMERAKEFIDGPEQPKPESDTD